MLDAWTLKIVDTLDIIQNGDSSYLMRCVAYLNVMKRKKRSEATKKETFLWGDGLRTSYAPKPIIAYAFHTDTDIRTQTHMGTRDGTGVEGWILRALTCPYYS